MSDDRMQVARAADQVVIRIVGRATMQDSPALRKTAEMAIDSHHLVWDMSECEYLDSTMLGCLIGVRKEAERLKRQMVIVADKPRQVKLFTTSSLDKFFDFIDECPQVSTDWMEIEREGLDTDALTRHVLVCHERLADRGGTDGEAFRRVVDRLSTEIEQKDMDRMLEEHDSQLGE
ncbi:STAS domain-containing protein [Aeoliella sp. ICT_H6.2]|uniref:STAS domain-containing protein n=1 Tax=Aeoliella straminimaris TaxID=2954799 RepID=A0A9X2F9G0_9BACT|nr:STAS domain-containing protein [Aeoliella straminimaris]MCO6044093.1 STAS domain-containing protein [Aeoliella straminimaris]